MNNICLNWSGLLILGYFSNIVTCIFILCIFMRIKFVFIIYGIKRSRVWVLILSKLFPAFGWVIYHFLCFWGKDSITWIFSSKGKSAPLTFMLFRGQLYIVVFNHSLVRHLGCFYILAIINNASLNIYEQVFMCFHFGYLPRIGIVGSCGMFKILRNFQTFPKELYHFIFLPVIYEGSGFSISSPTLNLSLL